MNTQKLIDTARALVAADKGLLAMDESTPTSNKRFTRCWGLAEHVSDEIVFRHVAHQTLTGGTQ